MAGRQPTHQIFSVTKHEDRNKRYWTRIGAAWAHDDGEGLSLRMTHIPTDFGNVDLVIRKRKPRDEQSQAQRNEPPFDDIPF
jgi:hypothetical protein